MIKTGLFRIFTCLLAFSLFGRIISDFSTDSASFETEVEYNKQQQPSDRGNDFFPSNAEEDPAVSRNTFFGRQLINSNNYDTALTALSFLSFGVFLLNLLMMAMNRTSERTFRETRSVPGDINTLSELAELVQEAISSYMFGTEFPTDCVMRSLCSAKEDVKTEGGIGSVLLPVASLSLNYLFGGSDFERNERFLRRFFEDKECSYHGGFSCNLDYNDLTPVNGTDKTRHWREGQESFFSLYGSEHDHYGSHRHLRDLSHFLRGDGFKMVDSILDYFGLKLSIS